MKYIVLNLESLLMSFGCHSKSHSYRETNEFPTISSIFGMICCAFGKSGELTDFFNKLREIKVEMFSYKETDIETDYQTFGTGWKELKIYSERMLRKNDGSNVSGNSSSKVIHKDYLVNQHFRVLLEVNNEEFADELIEKLQNPIWKIYIGRKKCIPYEEVFEAAFDTKEEAIIHIEKDNPLYKYTEYQPDDDKFIRLINLRDIPTVKFNDYGTYLSRKVFVSEY